MIDRRGFLKSVAAAGLPAGAQSKSRPNFLFMIADDLTFRAVGALGSSEVQTPNIDRVFARGCGFTRCFHQGSWQVAVCVPSRTMLNCGLTTFRARKQFEQSPLWGETFGAAGYDTFIVGKWHLSRTSLSRCFKERGPISPAMFQSGPGAYNRPSFGNTWTPWDFSRKGQWLHTKEWVNAAEDEIRHSAAIWADVAVKQIEEQAGRQNPFFMYVGFNSPHDPRQAPRDYVERYPRDRVAIPPSYWPEHPFDQGDRTVRDELLAPFPRTREAVQLHRSEYYAHITYMDAQIGRILDALDKSPQAGNTYVILTADHGLAVGEHGLMGKQNLYEHSVHMPYAIFGPGITAGRKVDAFVYQHSTFATTCELAGIPVPKSVEFPSLVDLIHGSRAIKHESVFCWYREYQRSIRTPEFRLIVYPKAGVTQLFDLRKNTWETENLADKPRYKATVEHLRQGLRTYQRELGDDFCQEV